LISDFPTEFSIRVAHHYEADLTMRVARPTDNLAEIAEMYAKGLGFAVLAEFRDHRGFDGVILGHPRQPYHIEFTAQRGYEVRKAPTRDHLLVFYIPDKKDWETNCGQMRSAGFRQVPSYNPYWDLQGKTFEDIDGYRVVLQNAAFR
jgi:hypothetical protein